MYQSNKLTLFIFIILFVQNSKQTSDLDQFQILSSNQEISYFINYLDNLFLILNQTLNEYSTELSISNLNESSSDFKNSTCFNHLRYTIEMAKKETPWALQMFDSMGKPSPGIMQAGFSFLGLFSECIDTTNDFFNGKYCLATISLPSSIHQMFQRYSSKRNQNWSDVQAKLGICVPSTCSKVQISSFTNRVLSKLIKGSSATFSNCYEKESANDRTITFYIASSVLILFVTIILIATIYDYRLITKESKMISEAKNCQKVLSDSYFEQCADSSYFSSSSSGIFTLTQERQTSEVNSKINLFKNKIENSLPAKVLLCFSIIKNSKKLFNTTSPEDDSISCLHGIKFLCMLWIIFGHSYSFSVQWLFFSNPNQLKESSQNLFSQIFANFTFSVDIFFFVSGLLVCTSALKTMKKTGGKLNLIYFYLYRYLRMAPLMLITILFSANILRTLGEGPVWLESLTMYDSWCKKNWYLNVLHIHNFVDTQNMCLSHSWYSAVDLQFYFISPLILIPLYKRPKLGLGILFAILFTSITIIATLTSLNDYPAIPYLNGNISLNKLNDYYRNIYIMPYCRIGPYLIGMFLGYLIYKRYTNKKISKFMHLALTVASITTLCAIIFSMQDANNGIKPSITMATFYSSCSRTLFVICLAYFIFCFINNKFKMLNALLSAQMIRPFSRVSFSAYLIHPIIMASFYGSREQSFVFSNYLMFYFIIGHIFLTYLISFVITVFFESPFINLSRLFLK